LHIEMDLHCPSINPKPFMPGPGYYDYCLRLLMSINLANSNSGGRKEE